MIAWLLACLPAAAQAPVFVEVVCDRPAPFVRETVRLRLQVGVDRDFLRERLVQASRRALDLPVQIAAPWWEGTDALIALPEPAAAGGAGAPQLALNEAVRYAQPLADREQDGRRYAVYEVARDFAAAAAGELRLDAPTVRYAFATRFEEDFLGTRVAADRQDALAQGADFLLAIQPWPEAGRPPSFDGAVGSYELGVQAEPLELEVGEVLRLTVRIHRAAGGLDFPRPELRDLAGFHLLGVLEERAGDDLELRAELQLLDAAVTAVPALDAAFLDPGPPPRYCSATSAAVPLRVRAHAAPPATSERPTAGGKRLLPWLAAAMLALLVGAAWWRRRNPAAAPPPHEPHVPGGAGEGPEDLLAAALAQRLRCSRAAVMDPRLRQRLEAAGVPAALAADAARMLEALTAARYGGPPVPDAASAAREIVAALRAVAPRT